MGFKDHNQKTTYIQFYRSKKNPDKTYFATTALDGQIYVYPLRYSPPIEIEGEEDILPQCELGERIEIWFHEDHQITKQAFSVIEFHPDGFIVGTTLFGTILIYRKIEDIEKDSRVTKSKITWQEHTKDCHLISWHPNEVM